MSEPIDLDDLQRVGVKVRELTDDNWLADMVELARDEIARLREERRSITTLLGKVETLEAENKRLSEERRWVPAGEGLPKEPRRVLAFVPSVYGPQVAFVSNGKWQDGTEYSIGGRVTHWMPLPPGPEANG